MFVSLKSLHSFQSRNMTG